MRCIRETSIVYSWMERGAVWVIHDWRALLRWSLDSEEGWTSSINILVGVFAEVLRFFEGRGVLVRRISNRDIIDSTLESILLVVVSRLPIC